MQTPRVIWLIVISVIAFVMIVWLARSYRGTRNVEKPKVISVVQLSGNIEIYTVAPMIIATVKATGTQQQAIYNGFRQLAAYIFGDNTTRQPVAMTAPVAVKQAESTIIAMTAPVAATKKGDTYEVSFMMPSNFTRETLPEPNNANITFVDMPSKKYYVWKFSGYAGESRAQRQLNKFLDTLQDQGIKTIHTPILNQYNDPRTIGFMRRNEWWIEM